MTDLKITEATIQLVVNEQEPVFLQVLRGPIVVSGGGGVTVHNDLTGRSDPDAHPISSITGLSAALAAAGNVDSVNGQTGTVVLDLDDLTDVDTTTDPPDADDVLAWDGVMWTPATLQALGAPDLSNATPADLGVAAPGVASEASRADHVHDMPSAADVGADPAGTAAGLVDDLSGVSNQATARTNLGLGSAAVEAASAFATAAQGVDARTPTAHKVSHQDGGSDELALDASQITTGTVPTARLGSGSASSTTYLLGDQTWAKSARPILTASRRVTAGFGTPLTPLSNYASTAAVGKGGLYGLLCHNRPETISELMIEVTATSLTGSQVVIVGAADLNGGLPGSLLWSESITVGTTTGTISKTGLSRALPEWCWLIVLNPNSNAGTVTLRGGPPSLNAMQILAPFSAATGNRGALASPYTSADTLPSSFSSYVVTAGVSSTAGQWGFWDVFPLISAVV